MSGGWAYSFAFLRQFQILLLHWLPLLPQCLRKTGCALASVGQCLEHHPVTRRLQVWFSVRAHAWVAGSFLVWAWVSAIPSPDTDNPRFPVQWGSLVWVCTKATNHCFSHTDASLFPFLSFSKNKQASKQTKNRLRWQAIVRAVDNFRIGYIMLDMETICVALS